MQLLKQSTSIKVRIGGFYDATDGVTPETGITLGAADQAELLKHNGAATVDISARTWAAVTGCDGFYDLTLSATDTNTLGQMSIVVADASVCLPVWAHFMVVTANYWDSLHSSDYLDVNVHQINADTNAAANLARSARGMVIGTCGSGSTTTNIVSGLTTTADQFNGGVIVFAENTTTTALQGQKKNITDTDASGNLTVTAFSTAPVSGDIFAIV